MKLIKKVAENALTNTESAKVQGYIKEIANAIADAVAATAPLWGRERRA